MEKFRGKHRIESNRLRGWDYSATGYYFITIVTNRRKCIFGNIVNNDMILSDFGIIACDEWHKSFKIRQELLLDECILMPNHLHAIVIINTRNAKENNESDINKIITAGIGQNANGYGQNVETYDRTSLRRLQYNHSNRIQLSRKSPLFQRKPKSISSFVAGYKSAVITSIDNYIDTYNLPTGKFNTQNPLWQANYHDHIIRNEKSYLEIKQYIRNNTAQWDDDTLYDTDF